MAECCAFCGKELKVFGKETLWCGGVTQSVCRDCADRYVRAGQIERCRELLKTGRAREPEKVAAFLEREEKRQQERAKWRERASRCPACGAEMELKLENFSIGADGAGGLMTLLADTYEVDLYACPVCGKVELYTADFWKEKEKQEESREEEPEEEPEQSEPRNGGFWGLGKRKETRPPWEK